MSTLLKVGCDRIFPVAVILAVLLAFQTSCARVRAAEDEAAGLQVKNIILFIGDGMQLENEIAFSRYMYGTDTLLTRSRFPYYCYVTTWDVDSYNRYARSLGREEYSADSFDPYVGYDPSRGGVAPYRLDPNGDRSYFLTALPTWGGGAGSYAIPATDSAAAATSIATGVKTDEGNISWEPGDPADGAIKTIAEKMRENSGAAIGVVTTVQFSHATPGPFVAHNVSRGNPGQIAHEMITVTKPEVVIGGGHPNWNTGYISTSDLNLLRDSTEYVLVERQAGVNGGEALLDGADRAVTEGKRLFGLFGGSRGDFVTPQPVDSPGSPGFTDDDENPQLADAVQAALHVLSQDPDGFFLMAEQGDIDVANHYGNYPMMIGAMWDLEEAVQAALDFVVQPGDSIDLSNTMIIVTSDHATGYLRLSPDKILGKGELPVMTGTNYHHSYPDGELSYAVGQHTNELVMLYAAGSGARLFYQYEGFWYPGERIIDNTHIYRVMCEAAGIPE
jgi:alkaline phosphatase